MSKRFGIVAIALVATGVPGCAGDPLGPRPEREGEPLQTDRVRYEAARRGGPETWPRYTFEVVVEFDNPTDRTVYVGRCFPDSPGPIYGIRSLEPRSEWGAAWSVAWGCVGHSDQFAVGPRGTRVDTLLLTGPNARDGRTGEWLGDLTGRFRIEYDVRYCPDECPESLPVELRRSNAFQVILR